MMFYCRIGLMFEGDSDAFLLISVNVLWVNLEARRGGWFGSRSTPKKIEGLIAEDCRAHLSRCIHQFV